MSFNQTSAQHNIEQAAGIRRLSAQVIGRICRARHLHRGMPPYPLGIASLPEKREVALGARGWPAPGEAHMVKFTGSLAVQTTGSGGMKHGFGSDDPTESLRHALA